MSYTDPTKLRLSDSFLLSDFLGCTSVYKNGYRNVFTTGGQDYAMATQQGMRLANTLEKIQEELGSLSVCYGYISPELSKKIVKYQDPNKPSFHRWDLGAAADIRVHCGNLPPIYAAFQIDDVMNYARMITYSESPWICVATSINKNGNNNVLYENRYIGHRTPKRITYSKNESIREQQKRDHSLPKEVSWRGQGYPSYHGGGVRQYEHQYCSRSTTVLDFLYNNKRVRHGVKNNLPVGDTSYRKRVIQNMRLAGNVMDDLHKYVGKHISIVSAYAENGRFRSYSDSFILDIVPPKSINIQDLAHFASSRPGVDTIRTKDHRIRILGEHI